MTKDEIILANKEYLFPAVFHYYKEPLVISHAKDQYVWDADGHQYLDFFGGIVTVSVGHCNQQVNAKVHQQMDKLQHVSTVFANEPQAALAKKIAQITPGGKLTKSFFTNSGTEANETAILAARCYTGNTEIVAQRHDFGVARIAARRQNRRFIGLRSAIREERFRQLAARSNLRNLLGQRGLRLIRKYRGYVLQLVHLLVDLGIHLLVTMAHAYRNNAAEEVQILMAVGIPHILILGVRDHHRFLVVMKNRRKQVFLISENDFVFCH